MTWNKLHGKKEHCIASSKKMAINLSSSIKCHIKNIKKLTTKKKHNFANKWSYYHTLKDVIDKISRELKK